MFCTVKAQRFYVFLPFHFVTQFPRGQYAPKQKVPRQTSTHRNGAILASLLNAHATLNCANYKTFHLLLVVAKIVLSRCARPLKKI